MEHLERVTPPLSRVPLLGIVAAFIAGILLYTLPLPLWVATSLITAGIVFHFLYKQHYLALTFVAAALGLIDAAVSAPQPLPPGMEGEKLSYAGTAVHAVEKPWGQAIDCKIDSIAGNATDASIKVRINYLSVEPAVSVGECIHFSTELEPPKNHADLPSDFDYAAYLKREGFSAVGLVGSGALRIVSEGEGFDAMMAEWRLCVERKIFEMPLDAHTHEFLAAVLLGDSDILDTDVRQLLADAGAAHVLALSGLHVGIIAMLLGFMLYPLTLAGRHRLRIVLTIAALWAFAVFTGLSASVVRATVMASFVLAGRLLQRYQSPFNSLLAAALVILLFTPMAIYSVGFQLSFAAVGAILAVGAPVREFTRNMPRVVASLVSYVAATLSALLTAGVISMIYFHSFPVYSLLGNVIAFVVLPVLIALALVMLLISTVMPAPILLCRCEDFLYHCVEWIAGTIGSLPGAVINDVYVSGWIALPAAAAFVALVIGLHKQRIIWYATSGVMVVTAFAVGAILQPDYPEHEYFISADSRGTTLIVRDADSLYVVTTALAPNIPEVMDRITRYSDDYRGSRGLNHFSLAPDSINGAWFSRRGNIVDLGEERIALVSADDGWPDASAGINKLLVCGGFKGDIRELRDYVQPDTLIITRSVNDRRARRYQKELSE